MSFDEESDLEVIWCCVRDCKTNNKENQCNLFSLPITDAQSYLWLKNADRLDLLETTYDLNLRETIKICEIHFESEMFTDLNKNCIIQNAIPTSFEFSQQCSETTVQLQYSKMEDDCMKNQGIIIIGDVVKIDPFFQGHGNNENNMENISCNEADMVLGTSNRTSTVISILKHDTVVPIDQMESDFFKNNLENNEMHQEKQHIDEKSVDLDEEYPEDNKMLMDALNKRQRPKQNKKSTKIGRQKKLHKRSLKNKNKEFLSTRKNSKRFLKESTDDNINFIEFRRKDFYKICRLCFSDDISELIDINNSTCQGKTFANILESNTNFEPVGNKNISRFICQKCTTNLLLTYNFYNNLQISTTILMDAYKTLSESSNRKVIRISNWDPTLLKLDDCEYEKYADSIKKERLNVIETVKVEMTIDYDSDRLGNNDPNDDSYWSDEDYDSLIKIKRENALKQGMSNNENTNDSANDNSREFANKIEVISEDDDSSSDSDPPPRKRRKRKYIHRSAPIKSRQSTIRKRNKNVHNPTEDDLTCPECRKLFPNRASLSSHQRNVHVTVECEVCGMRLKGASIRWHMRVMHSMVNGVEDREAAAPKKVLCVKCGKWVRAHKYKIHLKTHMVTKPFACDICDYRTSDKHRLIPHKLLHTGEKPHLCSTCGEGFHRKDYLKVHVALHTQLDVPITCNTCPQSFGTKFEYHTHRRLIHGYQKVGALPRVRLINGETVQTVQKSNTRSCHICQKVFPRNNKSFYVHMREHIPRPVRCSLCNKQCNSPEALKSHMRTHTGEKPFKCKLCDKAYSQYGHLQSHRATFHENKRAFKCEYCDKAFNLSIGLKEHIRIHTGETLDCEYCGKAFRQRSNFYKHLREVHSIRKRELNREQFATQNATSGSNDCLTELTNALTD